VFDGLRASGTFTDWVIRWMRPLLPEATISPTCAKQGHKWSEPLTIDWSKDGTVNVFGCVRCAKRGLIVLTDVARAEARDE
jgi:hypothetical protein